MLVHIIVAKIKPYEEIVWLHLDYNISCVHIDKIKIWANKNFLCSVMLFWH